MSHYRSNLRDIEFNLFEFLRIHEQLGGDLDRETIEQMLSEVERLASNEWADSFVPADRTPLALVNGEVRLPGPLLASLAALQAGGWDRVGLPPALGGVEVPRTVLWAMQEMWLGANPTAAFYAAGPLFARVIHEEGTEEQRALARLMIERHWAGTMVLTEPDAGSDVGAGTTRAVHIEGLVYHLEGVKRFITAGEHDAAENIVHLVLARPEGAGPGTKGLSLFIVPKFLVTPEGWLGERNGVVATRIEHKMGIRGSATCELTFGAGRPALGYLLGGVHDGIRQMFRIIEHARMTIGTKSTATLSTGYLNALAYAKERIQGADLLKAADKSAPRVSIIRHPDVRRMLVRQKATAEGLRALVLYTAWVEDQAGGGDEGWERRADLLLPMVKGYSSERAYQLLSLSLQVLGGSGFTEDYPIEQYIRDAKIDSIYEGTTAIQALDLFFRKIVRDQGATIARLAGEIREYAKAGSATDPIAAERELLAQMLEDVQTHLGSMVERLMAPDRREIYRAGLHANGLLDSLAEVVISWLMLRQAEIAFEHRHDSPFYAGKLAAAKYFVREAAPQVAARRQATEAEDGALMELADEAF
jgi:hypothetical protein